MPHKNPDLRYRHMLGKKKKKVTVGEKARLDVG